MKIKIANRYGVVPHSVLMHPLLSMRAKGLFAYIQSKPDDWDFSADRIVRDCRDGRDSVRQGLRELETFGFLQRSKEKDSLGRWSVEYTLSDTPCDEQAVSEHSSMTEFPSRSMTDIPTSGFPTSGNPSSKKERKTKKEIQKKKTYSEKIEKSFQQFLDHRKNIKKPVTQRALDMLESKIDDWRARGFSDEAIASFFDESVMNGWTGVFERQQNNKSTLQKLPSRSQDFF